jgi:hypothetical protein
MEQRRLSGQQVQVLLIPAVVCAALSIELGFKALLFSSQCPVTGHALDKLFESLLVDFQEAIVTDVGITRPEFVKSLGLVVNVFVDWRYIYEKIDDVNLNLDFLKKLADATQQVINDQIVP